MTLINVDLRVPAWMAEGSCNDPAVDPNLFFPTPGTDRRLRKAVAICDSCPVRDTCAAFAEREHVTHGVWGGIHREDRRRRSGPWREQVNADVVAAVVDGKPRIRRLTPAEHDEAIRQLTAAGVSRAVIKNRYGLDPYGNRRKTA